MEFYELIRKMDDIVRHKLTHYQNDFYLYDIPYLAKYNGYKKEVEFSWFLRDTGTHMVSSDCENASKTRDIYREYNDTEYLIIYEPIPYSWDGKWHLERVS